jgi:hypothetical protein
MNDSTRGIPTIFWILAWGCGWPIAAAAAAQDPVPNPDASVKTTAVLKEAGVYQVSVAWSGFAKKPEDPNPVQEYSWRVDVKNPNGKGTTPILPLKIVGPNKGDADTAELPLLPKKQYVITVFAKRKTGPAELASQIFRLSKPASAGEAAGSRPLVEPVDRSRLPEVVRDALEEPATRNRLLKDDLKGDEEDDEQWSPLKGLTLELKLLTTDADRDLVPGIGYSYQKSIHIKKSETYLSGLDFSLSAEGNVAFDSSKNPKDFLVTSLSLDYFISQGGVETHKTPEGEKLIKMLHGESTKSKEELRNSSEWREYHKRMQEHLSTQVYFEAQLQASLESDQNFTNKQYAFELQACIEVKAWKNSSVEARYNIFDWPFSFVRLITGYDEQLWVRGASYPTVVIAVGRVKPIGEDPRATVGDPDDFWRVRADISFRTPVARVADTTVYFDANLRLYQELKASAAVKQARLDRFAYIAVDLSSETGVYASYAAGRLPFDRKDDRIFDLGYKFNF